MSLYPHSIDGKINWFESKTDPWAASAVAIGTTSAQVTSFTAKVAAARAKLAEAVAAREAAKTATVDLREAVDQMVAAGADIIRQVRAKGAIDGAGVYSLAQIPPPATPGPVGPPGTPTQFRATLNPDGSLKVGWKCPNPAGAGGTIYQVARRVGGAGEFVMIGATGNRSFLDTTVPAGVASVTYQITAVRSTVVGTAAPFTVNFGVSASTGEAFATVAIAPKLAA